MSLREAALASVNSSLDSHRDLVVLGAEGALGRYLGRENDPRLIPTPPGPTRASIAAGLHHGGKRVVTLAHDEGVADGPLPSTPQVILATALTPARRWWAGGATVVRPVTTGDVPALLDQALDADGPVVLRLDEDVPLADLPSAGVDLRLGAPRVLAHGGRAVVVGQGPVLAGLQQSLDDADVTLVDLHTLGADAPVAPGAMDHAVLVGQAGRLPQVAEGDLRWMVSFDLPAGTDAGKAMTLLHELPSLLASGA